MISGSVVLRAVALFSKSSCDCQKLMRGIMVCVILTEHEFLLHDEELGGFDHQEIQLLVSEETSASSDRHG